MWIILKVSGQVFSFMVWWLGMPTLKIVCPNIFVTCDQVPGLWVLKRPLASVLKGTQDCFQRDITVFLCLRVWCYPHATERCPWNGAIWRLVSWCVKFNVLLVDPCVFSVLINNVRGIFLRNMELIHVARHWVFSLDSSHRRAAFCLFAASLTELLCSLCHWPGWGWAW